jgi:hypothetical protein
MDPNNYETIHKLSFRIGLNGVFIAHAAQDVIIICCEKPAAVTIHQLA